MRLESIHIKNLGPFQERHVDLTALPPEAKLVAITGPNGAGKSTLLELATGGAAYRDCPTRGSLANLATARDASLEVHLVNGSPWTIRHSIDNVSGKGESIALNAAGEPAFDTGKVRDFDRWAASVLPPPEVLYSSIVSPQGSGGFLEMKASDRKATLLRVLGVERIESIATAARVKAREVAYEYSLLTDRVAYERHRCGDVEQLEADLVAARKSLETAEASLQTARQELDDARARLAESREAMARFTAACDALLDAGKRRDAALEELGGIQKRIANNRRLLENAAEVRQAVADVERLTAERDALQATRAELGSRRTGLQTRHDALARTSIELTARMAGVRDRLDKLNARLVDAPRIDTAITVLPVLRVKAKEAQDALEEALGHARRVRGERIAGADKRIGALRSGLDQIRLDAEHGASTSELGMVAADTLEEDTIEGRRAADHPLELARAEEALDSAQEEFEEHRKRLGEAEAFAAHEKQLDEDMAAAAEAEEELKQLSNMAFTAGDERRGVEMELRQVESEFSIVSNTALCLDSALDEAKQLASRATQLVQAQARIAELETHEAAAKERVDAIVAELEAMPDPVRPEEPEGIGPFDARAAQAEIDVHTTAARVNRCEVAVEQALESAERIAELDEEHSRVALELSDWNRLATDLGRDGLQATLIDAAGPELTELTNDLLRTCVGSRWTVSFETTRLSADRKRQLEGLDVRVIDSERGRDTKAETLSGGERVLVGEAVSLALSVLACRKAGIERPTLVRDESGAALDQENGQAYVAMLRRAVDLVGADRCLLVSHSPAVQEACDERIEL